MNFNNEDFINLEKYVVTKGDNWEGDRLLEIVVSSNIIVLCMDEVERKVLICTIDGQPVDEDNEFIAILALEKLIEDSKVAVYTEKEEKEYNFYLEEIRMETECPEEAGDMYVLQASDWEDIVRELVK